MTTPKAGDVIVAGSDASGFLVFDAATNAPVGPRVKTLSEAVNIARERGAHGVWQQNLDKRGRPMGPPWRLPLP